MNQIWRLKRQTQAQSLVMNLLEDRGYASPQAMAAYLHPSLFDLYDPFLFRDMGRAADRIRQAYAKGESILIYGDYDVDGVTATALLYRAFSGWGLDVRVHIPERASGYGLHADIIEKAVRSGIGLLITVDCGITACEEIKTAQSLGLDVIITDHHEPGETLPAAFALINPKEDGAYPFDALAGVGVAFKLMQAVAQVLGRQADSRRYLDLVALGTIADVVPLIDENRIFVTYGLRQMMETCHPGLKALLAECGLQDKVPRAGQIAFMVAPRINAAGRMDTCRLALNLFLTEEAEEAALLARELSRENTRRQKVEQDVLVEAQSRLALGGLPRVIVLSSPTWPHGVIGIVASRLTEKYNRPTFLIAEEGEQSKGSARGIQGYHVFNELTRQKKYLTVFGGHRHAAGFTIGTAAIPQLKIGLNEALAGVGPDFFDRRFSVDAEVPLKCIDLSLCHELERLAPFGMGNPTPVFGCRRLQVTAVKTIGQEGKHLKLWLKEPNEDGTYAVLAFNRGTEETALRQAPLIDLLYTIEAGMYQGQETVQIIMKSWMPSAEAQWEDFPPEEPLLPRAPSNGPLNTTGPGLRDALGGSSIDRTALAAVYRALKSQAAQQTAQQAAQQTAVPVVWAPEQKNTPAAECVKILEELELVTWLGGTGPWSLLLATDLRKRDLTDSWRFRILSGSPAGRQPKTNTP